MKHQQTLSISVEAIHMSSPKRAVLAAVVDRYERSSQPQSESDVEAATGLSSTTVADAMDSLQDLDLVRGVDEGYRPTTTGQQLLELDLPQDGFVVVDVINE